MSAEVLKVPDSLAAMASRWQIQAGELSGTPPKRTASSWQPSATAMSMVLAGTRTALVRLSARMETSGADVSLADTNFDDNEAATAAELRTAGERVV